MLIKGEPMAKSLNQVLKEKDSKLSADNSKYSFEKMSSELDISRININDSNTVKTFASELLKSAAEVEKNDSAEPYQLNPVEKLAEFVVIADMLSKKAGI